MRKIVKRRILKIVIYVLLLIFLFGWLDRVFISKHRYWDGYDENFYQNYVGFDNLPDHSLEIIFLGSSNVFLDLSPLDLYDEYGYTSYSLATPMQMLEQSYYQLKEAFKTQSPKMVLLDCLAFEGYDYNGEPYTHMAYDAYPLSIDKVKHLKESLYDNYDFHAFLFPYLLYHSRYDELDMSDLSGKKYDITEDFLGYAPAFSVSESPVYGLQEGGKDSSISDDKMLWFSKIDELCKEHEVELILFKTPCQTSWYLEDSKKMVELSQQYGRKFWELGGLETIDPELDFCDGGGHLNDDGAVKVTKELGKRIANILGVLPLKEDIKQYFDRRVSNLNKCRAIQRMKYVQVAEEYLHQLHNGDYTIAIAGKADEVYKNAFFDLLGNVDWVQENRFAIVYHTKTKQIQINFDETSAEVNTSDIYCRSAVNEDSLLQFNYDNYQRWNSYNDNVHIMVIDNEYNKVVDIAELAYKDDELKIVRA